ncbi:hypothetical protein [Streptomyces sp. NBC_00872]|uniref:hypothetical protein n=1 Tax=Streptomyces sp. NBC_00872 TaxID=2903686 RepID=UPI003863E346|nr:hypothetical protein OG214_06570 [Streptomyces sp. NBC_00872]
MTGGRSGSRIRPWLRAQGVGVVSLARANEAGATAAGRRRRRRRRRRTRADWWRTPEPPNATRYGLATHAWTWDVHDDRRRGFWGNAVIESWHEEATPVLDLDGSPRPVSEALLDESAIQVGADGLG